MMRIRHGKRRALGRIAAELNRQDPLLAAMLTEEREPAGEHPENGRARRRKADDIARPRGAYTPLVMF
jgi:hypothetical protein